ncbi:MAG: hypothetical protein R6U40_07120 [Desulfobacterales bacterium]
MNLSEDRAIQTTKLAWPLRPGFLVKCQVGIRMMVLLEAAPHATLQQSRQHLL